MRSAVKSRLHYGWLVVGAVCLVNSMALGVVVNCFGQFIKPVCAALGFSRGQMGLAQSLMFVIQFVFSISWGGISRRIHLRRWVCTAAVILPVSFFCYSFARDISAFYLITLPVGLCNSLLSMVVLCYIVGNWFVKDKGLAIGLSSMGSGLGAMVMNPVINHVVVEFGWQAAYRAVAVIIFIVIVPPVFLIMHEKPSDKGLLPYGLESGCEGASASEALHLDEGAAYSQVIRSPSFWLLMTAVTAITIAVCSVYQNVAPHLSDCGYSVEFAAWMASASMGALAFGKIILGRMFDYMSSRTASFFSCFCAITGALGLIFCQSAAGLAAIIFGVGMGCSYGAVCLPIVARTAYGMKDYNSIYGKLNAANSIGSAAAPLLCGAAYDAFGSYVPMYIICVGLLVLSIIAIILTLPKKDRY